MSIDLYDHLRSLEAEVAAGTRDQHKVQSELATLYELLSAADDESYEDRPITLHVNYVLTEEVIRVGSFTRVIQKRVIRSHRSTTNNTITEG